MSYDLFISYSRKDNSKKRVSQLKRKIEADYLKFSGEKLRCFFDTEEIKSMDDWRHRILQGLKESHLFLLILSPNYLSSPYCEWEITEYLKYEYSRAVEGGIAQIYFLEIPGIDEPDFIDKSSDWFKKISYRQKLDLRPWYEEGEQALKRRDVKRKLKELNESLYVNLSRLHSAEKSPGNLPAPNKRFVGRENEMKKLHEETGLGKFGVITAVHGMGGLGKTSIAIQYAYSYSHFYPGGRWQIGCEGKTSLAGVLRELDAALDIYLTDEEKKDDKLAAQRILRELEKRAMHGAKEVNRKKSTKKKISPATLLILDNVDKAKLIQSHETDILSGKKWLKLLVTTRMGEEDLGYDKERQSFITIDELPQDDAIKLIESYQQGGVFPNEKEREAAKEIVKLLDGLTLAVEMTAIYLRDTNYRVTCQDFLKLLKSKGGLAGAELAAKQSKTSISHEKLVSLTLAPTLEKLSEKENLVLSYASQLPPDNIPIPWLKDLVKEKYPKLGKKAKPGMDDSWLSLINRLISLRIFQVVEVHENIPRIVKMHKLVANLIRNTTQIEEKVLIYFLESRAIFLKKLVSTKNYKWEIHSFKRFLEDKERLTSIHLKIVNSLISIISYWGYTFFAIILLKKCIDRSEKDFNKKKILNELKYNLGILLWEFGKYNEAKNIINEINNSKNSTFDFSSSQKYYILGVIELDLENLIESKQLLKKSIFLESNKKNPNNNLLLLVYSYLLIIEFNSGSIEKVKKYLFKIEYMKRKIHIYDKGIAIAFSNIGGIYWQLGKLYKAKKIYEHSIRIDKKIFHDMYPHLSTRFANLALVLADMGQLEEAKKLLFKAIDIEIKNFGDSSIRLSIRYSCLGSILNKLGDLLESRKMILKSIIISKNFFNEFHPSFAYNYNNLAMVEKDLGNFSKAKRFILKAIEIGKRNYSEDNPILLKFYSSLGVIDMSLGHYNIAEKILKKVLFHRIKILSKSHPETKNSYSLFISLLEKTNRFKEARLVKKEMKN